jgi:hypothetical protein
VQPFENFFKKLIKIEKPPDPYEHPAVVVPSLTCLDENDKPYERSRKVSEEIAFYLARPLSELIKAVRDVENETVVFFLRHVGLTDEEVYDCLFEEVGRRTARIAKRHVWLLDRDEAKDVVSQVEVKILELAVDKTQSRKAEFLEMSFVQAVEFRAIKAAEQYQNSPFGKRGWFSGPDDDASDIEQPFHLLPDRQPNPEEAALNDERKPLERNWIDTAFNVIKDPRRLLAFVLRHGYGWPFVDRTRDTDLERLFGVPEWRLRRWQKRDMLAVRAAI